jgi:hypothetical protein
MLSNNGVFMEDLTNMIKPVVHFIGDAKFYEVDAADGSVEYARVYGIDHPILGRDNIRTSLVVQKFSDGSFETLNTLYRPLKKDPLEIMAENARELGLDYDS